MGKLSRKQKRSATLSIELGDAMVASPLIRAAWAAAIEAGAAAAAGCLGAPTSPRPNRSTSSPPEQPPRTPCPPSRRGPSPPKSVGRRKPKQPRPDACPDPTEPDAPVLLRLHRVQPVADLVVEMTARREAP